MDKVKGFRRPAAATVSTVVGLGLLCFTDLRMVSKIIKVMRVENFPFYLC